MNSNTAVSQPKSKHGTAGAYLNARAMYFFYFMAIGAFLPFINLYYERLGLSGVQIGVLAALPALASSPAALVWGMLADAFHLHRGLFRVALLLAPLAVLALSQTARPAVLAAIVLVYAFVSAPIIPLLDSAALEVSAAHQRTYGDLRVWGTIGWALSAWLIGVLIQRFGIPWLFYGYAGFMGMAFLGSLFQPARLQALRAPLRRSLQGLFAQRGFLLFLLSLFMLTMSTGGVNYFFTLYLDGIGADEGTIGLAWTLAAASEVPVMHWSGAIMQRIGATGLLIIAFATYAVRWLLYSFITTPALVLPVQLLHGLSFAAFLTGGVIYVGSRAPTGLGTTAQAIFSAVAFGIGPFAGALLAGYLYDTTGMPTLFRILSLLAALGLAVFWLSTRSAGGDGVQSATVRRNADSAAAPFRVSQQCKEVGGG